MWDSIGYSVPALLGACLADQRRRHILVVGDGSFQVTAQELSTILRHELAPIIILLNNGVYLIENIMQPGSFKAMDYDKIHTRNYCQLQMDLAGTRKPLSLRVTTEEELATAFEAAAQAQREGRCTLMEGVLGAKDAPAMFKAKFG